MPTWKDLVALLASPIAACTNARPALIRAPVVIPFELRGDLAVVPVEVNGQAAKLILDTGSGAMAVDTAFAREARLDPNGAEAHVRGSSDMTLQLRTAHSVRLGLAPLVDVLVVATDISDVQARVGYDVRGTIGFELFDNYVVAVDYAARTITLYDPTTFHYRGAGTIVPFTIEHRLPVVKATIVTRKSGPVDARLHIDLGSGNYAIRLSKRFLAVHDISRDTTTITAPFGAGVGGATLGDLLRLPQLTLGSLIIVRPSTALARESAGAFGADAETDGTIGATVFKHTRLVIDYSRSQAIVEPRGRLDLPDSVDASGLSLTVEDGPARATRVIYVIDGSAGGNAGVRAGDELVQIDGRPVAALPRDVVRGLLRAAGETRHLTLHRGADTVDVTLRLKMIV
jgi:PDZ domain/Aspartyl protease